MKIWKRMEQPENHFAKCSIYVLCLVLAAFLFVGCKITIKMGHDSTSQDSFASLPTPETPEVISVMTTKAPTAELSVTSAVPVITENVSETTAPIDIPEPDTYYYDFEGDVFDEVVTFLPLPNEAGEICYVYDPISEKRLNVKSEIDEDIIRYERTEWGWKAKINNEIIYIRADDLKTEEPLFDQPKAVVANAYIWRQDDEKEVFVFKCVYNLYATESTLVGAIYKTYTYENGELTLIAWEYGESPSIEGPQYQKHSDEYIYSFLPDGAIAPITSGAPVGNVPIVISFDSANGEPLLYYTYDNGMTFLPIEIQIPEMLSCDSARVVDLCGGNSWELYLIFELQLGDNKEHYRVLYDYYNEYADGRFRQYGEWEKVTEPCYYYDFTGDGFLEKLQISPTYKDSAYVWDGKDMRSYDVVNDLQLVQAKYVVSPIEDGWKFTVDGKSAYVMAGAFAKDEKLYAVPKLSTVPYYLTEYSDDERSSFYTGDYSIKRCYDIYLGENSICGAICESLTFENGEFVPTKWEFICSPHSTVVPVSDWPKNYSETFLPDGAYAVECSGSVLGSEIPMLISYKVSGFESSLYISEGYGAVYFPIELDIEERSNAMTRVTEIVAGNSTEMTLVFTGEKTLTVDCRVLNYLWQNRLVLY